MKMSENIITEVGPVNDWDVEEYHGKYAQIVGYNEDGDEVVRRHFELKDRDTEIKHDGEWIPMNDIDDGGYPIDAMFMAWKNSEDES